MNREGYHTLGVVPAGMRRAYLDLNPVSRCDVGDGPARLLPDGLLGAAQQVEEAGQG